MGCTSVVKSLLENEEFQSLIQTFDPRYKVPRRAAVSKEIDRYVWQRCVWQEACVQRFLGDAHNVSLCADICTKIRACHPTLGITAHFLLCYSWPSTSSSNPCHQTDCATSIQCRDYPSDGWWDVSMEWGIPLSKVLATLTDNGIWSRHFMRSSVIVHALVSEVNKSSVATEKNLSWCSKKLMGDCPA